MNSGRTCGEEIKFLTEIQSDDIMKSQLKITDKKCIFREDERVTPPEDKEAAKKLVDTCPTGSPFKVLESSPASTSAASPDEPTATENDSWMESGALLISATVRLQPAFYHQYLRQQRLAYTTRSISTASTDHYRLWYKI